MTTPGRDARTARVVVDGAEYVGEWISVEAWTAGLGGPLPDGIDFRVVFLERVPDHPPEDLGDQRIAVVMAGGTTGSGEPQAATEAASTLREVREARDAYLTDRDAAQAANLQVESLEQAVAAAWRAAYASGTVLTEPSLDVGTRGVFADGEWADWSTRLGRMLFERSRPRAPDDDATTFLDSLAESLDLQPVQPTIGGIEAWLVDLTGRIESVRVGLQALAAAQGTALSPDAVRQLEQMQRVAAAASTSGFQDAVSQVFGGLTGLSAVVQVWGQWRTSLHSIPGLVAAVGFLNQAVVPASMSDLSTEREALAAQLYDQALQMAPQRWAELAEASGGFRRRFADAYVRHHEDYHARMSLLGHRLLSMQLRAPALEMLNTVEELGPAVADNLPPLVEEMYNSVGACNFALRSADVTDIAACPRCGITLESEPPELEAEQVDGHVRDALQTQNQRLSRAVIHRLLERTDGERLDRFVQAVQASDLNGLALVMDAELIAFVRALLREGSTR